MIAIRDSQNDLKDFAAIALAQNGLPNSNVSVNPYFKCQTQQTVYGAPTTQSGRFYALTQETGALSASPPAGGFSQSLYYGNFTMSMNISAFTGGTYNRLFIETVQLDTTGVLRTQILPFGTVARNPDLGAALAITGLAGYSYVTTRPMLFYYTTFFFDFALLQATENYNISFEGFRFIGS